MYSLRIRLWTFCYLAALLSSCQINQSAKDRPGLNVDLESTGDEKAQIELWSPARRKSNASFYFLTGEYETLSRNNTKARKLYENAYNLDPNPFLAVKLIESKASEDVEEALKLAKKMVLLYPEYADIQLLLGRLLTATGDVEKAELHLLKAKALDAENLEAYIFLIQLYQSQEKYKQAISIAKEFIKVNPTFAEGWAQLSRLYLLSKQYKEALEPARRAYEVDSSDPEHVQLYAVVLDLNKEKVKAAGYYDAILKLNPTNDELIARMVGLFRDIAPLEDILIQLKDTERAAGRAVPGIQLQMVFIYWELQQFAKASELLDVLTKSFPGSERVSYMSGLGRERTKQWEKAVETYRSFDPSSEFYGVARFRAIEILRKQGKIDEALALTREAVDSQFDRSVDFYPLAAQLMASRKNFREAAEFLSNGIQRFPDRFEFLFLKAVNLERAGAFEESVKTLKDLLVKDPTHAAGHNYLGYMFAERKIHLDEAEEHIKKALEIKPEDGYYLDSLGWVYFQRGQFEKALEILQKANEQVAGEGAILEHIADTYEELGENAKAIEYYDKALQTKIDDKDRQRISDKFKKIKK